MAHVLAERSPVRPVHGSRKIMKMLENGRGLEQPSGKSENYHYAHNVQQTASQHL